MAFIHWLQKNTAKLYLSVFVSLTVFQVEGGPEIFVPLGAGPVPGEVGLAVVC